MAERTTAELMTDLERLDEEYVQRPHELYDRLRVEAPVRPVVTPQGLKMWLVTRYADVRAALANNDLHKHFAGFGEVIERNLADQDSGINDATQDLFEHMLNADPPDHDRLRKLVTKAFTHRRIELLRPRVEQITNELLAGMARGTEVDLLDVFAFPLPITVICELLGVPVEDREDFRRWSNLLVAESRTKAGQQAAIDMLAYLTALVGAKRTDPGDDLISALIAASDDDDRLSEREVLSMAFLLLVAGHETTVNLIGNGLLALMTNPEQFAALRADRALLAGAIEEFLRYQGPVNAATFRYTTDPVEVGGVTIPGGELVLVALASANRDGERFPDADRLDIHRDTTGHLAFGHGIHYCLGAPLARLEAEVAFAGLLDRFDSIELAVPVEELRWRPGVVIRGLFQLPVRLG